MDYARCMYALENIIVISIRLAAIARDDFKTRTSTREWAKILYCFHSQRQFSDERLKLE